MYMQKTVKLTPKYRLNLTTPGRINVTPRDRLKLTTLNG
jgi:hypothetical protein